MFVYVIRSLNTGSEYVGLSDNPNQRLSEHNRGHVRSTKSNKPWQIVHLEEVENRVEARLREKYLKSAAGRRFRKNLRAISSAGYPPVPNVVRSGGERDTDHYIKGD